MMYIKNRNYNSHNIKRINKKDQEFNNKCINKEK